MHIRILDLDGSVTAQKTLLKHYRPAKHDLGYWGPRIRLGCRFGRFQQFEHALAESLDADSSGPALSFCGSGDFHHVSLALIRRLPGPINLLVLDNHPDWMRAIPFLHCGTWLYHAARLPHVQRIFHVGGDVDFDNGFRHLAPWQMLRSGKIAVFPSRRTFHCGSWSQVSHKSIRPDAKGVVTGRSLAKLLLPFRLILQSCPLYVSLDKDVLIADEATVNWDSGHLTLFEVEEIVTGFLDMARGKLAGMDIVGDWSPVRTQGLFRRFLHWTEHPSLEIEPADAARRNERTNLTLLNSLSMLRSDIRAAA